VINTSPYEDGWMIKIKVADPAEIKDLLDADAYQEFVNEEA
jgi:glycine cleavage system H protein